jgi:hypothetical protein
MMLWGNGGRFNGECGELLHVAKKKKKNLEHSLYDIVLTDALYMQSLPQSTKAEKQLEFGHFKGSRR